MITSQLRNRFAFTAAASLAAGLTIAGAAPGVASADTITRTPYGPVTGSTVVTDLCVFPVTVKGTQTGYLTDQVAADGSERLRFHGTETDVFTANGKTLTGLPYTSNIQLTTDAAGNVVRFTSEGISERVPLPQGGEFFAAGFTNWMLHPDAETLVNPDHGRMGNVEGLCAALT